MERIKILHIITHLGIGGAQDNTLLTVKGHSRDRFEVHLATGQDYTDWEEKGRAYADEFFRFPDLCRSANPKADILALNQLTDFLKKNQYHIVHTHSAKAGTLGRIAARRAKVPIIIHTFHSFGWQVACVANTRSLQAQISNAKKLFYMKVERYVAAFSDALITVSELNRQEAISINLAATEKFTTIYSGIDLERFKVNVNRVEKCASLGLDPNQVIVGTVGRLSVQKAPLDFIAAAKTVLQQKPNVQFIMIGDGPQAAEVRQAIANEPRIKLFGYRDDIPEILSLLNVFALSSHWEGLGRALTEAMLMKVPVAATAVDGVPELVTHQKSGLLSPPGQPARLAENIIWLLDNPEETQKMRKCAIERVIPAFDAKRMVEQIEILYERLLVEKGFITPTPYHLNNSQAV
ncbi:MAG: glycosyltransferase family 4 protein [Gammaproteobacteria bacterium]|nr:glycosyltransferase family 4 protein [Gammaproteobacteria bacterium]